MSMLQRALIVTSCVLLLVTDIHAQHFNSKKLDSLVSVMDDHNKIMGAITISKKAKIIYNKAWGYRTINKQEQLKTNTGTRFRIGSISKTFTAVMILQLVEEGKLDLTAYLAEFYPTLPNAKEITIEHLLNHHSGLYNFTDTSYINYHTQPKTHDELITIFEQQQPFFKPGTNGKYSNTNYVLLGFILEKITGDSYANNLKKRITTKIGLKNTYYGDKPLASKNEASSFSFNGVTWEEEPETHLSIPGGAGALVSTTNDLVKFIEALFAHKLVKKTTLDKMLMMKDGYGLGIFRFPFDERHCYGHTGGIDEFHSMLGYFPKDSMAFAFTGNGQTIEMNDFAIGVLSIYFDKAYQIPTFPVEPFNLSAEKMVRYEGTYTSSQHPLKITIRKEGNKLFAQATGQGAFIITPVNEREFKYEAARITMLFDLVEGQSIRQFTLKQGGGQFVFIKE